MHDRAVGMAVGHAGRPDPATARRSVPSAWPDSWAGGADSSGPTRLSTTIFQFPVETGHSDARSGGRDGRRTCRPAGPSDSPWVCAVGMAGQLGWECRLEWLRVRLHRDTTVHIHLSVPSRDWTLGCTIGRFSKPHVPCACSPLSGPSQTYGALVHSSRGGRPTWSACSWPRLHRGLIACHPGRTLRVTR